MDQLDSLKQHLDVAHEPMLSILGTLAISTESVGLGDRDADPVNALLRSRTDAVSARRLGARARSSTTE